MSKTPPVFTLIENQSLPTLTSQSSYVTIQSSKKWLENNNYTGKQYDGVFYNNSNRDITDWCLQIEIPQNSSIDSAWNFDYSLKNNFIQATSMDYNAVIPANDCITFGFVLITEKDSNINNIIISAHPIYQLSDYPLFYILILASAILVIASLIAIILNIKIAKYKKQRINDQNIIIQSMKTFSNFIDAKDCYTKGHSIRVAYYARELAKRMNLTSEEIERIYYIALLHDVGKISIPDAILNKPGNLTQDERKIIEKHTIIGGEMLKDFNAIDGIREGALYHHEHYDGTGYPEGLIGKSIPLYARIICVADSYDAMSSDRCYRKRLSYNNIIKELIDNSDKQFDSKIIVCMLDLLKDNSFLPNIRT